jgi:hypothetical protein
MSDTALLDDWVSDEGSFSGEDSAPDDDLALKLSPPLDLDQFDIIYVILFYHLSGTKSRGVCEESWLAYWGPLE